MSTLAGGSIALSESAEALIMALRNLAADNPAEMPALALEVIKTLSAKELALIILWRDGCRGNEPEHYTYSVTGAGDMISSEFTRKARVTVVAGKAKKK